MAGTSDRDRLIEEAYQLLSRFCVPSIAAHVAQVVTDQNVLFRITKPRSTKYGDFRPPFRGRPATISVNGDLSKDAFGVTALHELAHFLVWRDHGPRVKAHGVEWQRCFSAELGRFVGGGVFSEEVDRALGRYMRKPKASSCSDPLLFKVLHGKDMPDGHQHLSELHNGARFRFKERIFVKGELRRTRVECLEWKSGHKYLISATAPVILIANE